MVIKEEMVFEYFKVEMDFLGVTSAFLYIIWNKVYLNLYRFKCTVTLMVLKVRQCLKQPTWSLDVLPKFGQVKKLPYSGKPVVSVAVQ